MTTLQTEGSIELPLVAFRHLTGRLVDNGSTLHQTTEAALYSVLSAMSEMLSGQSSSRSLQLASLDPGTGKTEALCAILQAWKAASFLPDTGALIVLATRKEIESCVARSGLQPADYAILVQKDHPLNERGLLIPEAAPVLFTTQEKLRRECDGKTFAQAVSLHYRGKPRALRVWDEAFLPATPETIRKDFLVQPLADLRMIAPEAAASLESFSDSLSADRAGEAVQVPANAVGLQRALRVNLGHGPAERLAGLQSLAGREAVLVPGNGIGLHLAGGTYPIPADFAPALILDASGRVRETYLTMEAAGLLERLPSAATNYSRLRVHHWNRAASRSALSDPSVRQKVLEAASAVINDDRERWLVIHAQDRVSAGHSVAEELKALVIDPERLSFVHWGNHHGTNDYRDVGRVLVLGLWNYPTPAYSALHLAAGGSPDLATDKATLDALRAGENRHQLLQAICRASVRKGAAGTCGDCEVYLVSRLGKAGRQLLLETFPGAQVDEWAPVDGELSGSALRVALEVERQLAVPGVRKVQKGAVRTALGYRSPEALAKIIRRTEFREWARRESLLIETRAIIRASP